MPIIMVIFIMSVVFHEKHVRQGTRKDKAERQKVSSIFSGDHPENESKYRQTAENWYEPFFKLRLHYFLTSQVNIRAGMSAISENVIVTLLVDFDRLLANESAPLRWCPPGGEPSHVARPNEFP